MFLLGLQKLGKGDWRGISRNYVTTRTSTQVASHAQKYFIRQSNVSRRKRRSSLFDMLPDEVTDFLNESEELQAENIHVETRMQGTDSVPIFSPAPAPASLIKETEECESMDSSNSNAEELPATASASSIPDDITQPQPQPQAQAQAQAQPQPPSSFPVLYPAYFSPFFPFPFPIWPAGYVTEPAKEEIHEILRPTAVHSKSSINLDELLGMSKLSLGESSESGVSEQALSLKLVGGSSSRQSAFHPNPATGGSDMNRVIHAV